MKITAQILSIPPYISTAWDSVASLHVDHGASPLLTLIVTLKSGEKVRVPHITPTLLQAIFIAHSQFVEEHPKMSSSVGFSMPMMTNFPFGGMGAALQHNPEQMNAPDLPPELLKQVASFSQHLNLQDVDAIPEPELHCNCIHCQIARALQAGIASTQEEEEEIVSDEELKFRDWNITETATRNLFVVENPLDAQEIYHVYLGDPIGCTCGHKHCEHIRAVLRN